MFAEQMKAAPVNGGFKMDGYWVWCPSVIKGDDGRYHMFASRWKKSLPMHPGWLVASEIVRAIATRPEGPYEFQEVVLPARGPAYWDGRSTHNPSIMKVDDTYLLYYMGTTHPFSDVNEKDGLTLDDPRTIVARANKRIGLATAPSLTGPWQRMVTPILTTRPDKFDNFLVSNPAPMMEADGQVLMIYKCRSYKEDLSQRFLQSPTMAFGVARAKSYDQAYIQQLDSSVFRKGIDVEDPFLWEADKTYHMIAKDMKGSICGEASGGFYATSEDGTTWDLKQGVLAYSKKVLWDDGIVREMGNMERPFILFEEGQATHMFFATSDSVDGGGIMTCNNTWNMVIPLEEKG